MRYKMRVSIITPAVLFCLSLTGCMPIYHPAANVKTAGIDIKKLDNPVVCINNHEYQLEADKNGYARLPVGRRISISNHYSVSNDGVYYMVTTTCSPQLSFIPQENKQYFANFDIQNHTCILELYRKTNINSIGLIPESTARRSDLQCGKT